MIEYRVSDRLLARIRVERRVISRANSQSTFGRAYLRVTDSSIDSLRQPSANSRSMAARSKNRFGWPLTE